jgi:hypothetical protein
MNTLADYSYSGWILLRFGCKNHTEKTIVIAGLKWLINTYIEEGAITKEKADQLLEEVIIGKIEDIHHHL